MSTTMFMTTQLKANQIGSINVNESNTTSNKTLEAILAGNVLGEYDAQIEDFSNKMNEVNSLKTSLRTDKNKLNSWIENLDSRSYNNQGMYLDPDQYSEIKTIAKTVDNDELASLGVNNSYNQYYISKSQIENLVESIENKVQDLNSTSEIKMIQFQSLIDARKQTMMMLSNMINNDNQAKMSIIQNMNS